jgi:XRE family transcriptional regulator, regulator of sulfur utilization
MAGDDIVGAGDASTIDRSLGALAQNVRRARLARGLSLRALAELTGTSKALLSQIERCEANPTLAVVGRLAEALDQGVADLLRDALQTPTVLRHMAFGHDATSVETRTLFASMDRRRFEVTEGVIPAGAVSTKSSHGSGSIEYAYVVAGAVHVRSNGWEVALATGDAIRFSAEFEHVYEAVDHPARVLTIVGFDDD